MSTETYLVDTSALTRLSRLTDRSSAAPLANACAPFASAWEAQLSNGLLGVCPVTELEMLFTARSKADWDDMVTELDSLYPWVLMPDQVYERAHEIHSALADKGAHRSAGPVDLLVAATAELQGLTLLHYDRDFATVAEVTGQPAQWLAEPGSID